MGRYQQELAGNDYGPDAKPKVRNTSGKKMKEFTAGFKPLGNMPPARASTSYPKGGWPDLKGAKNKVNPLE
jgi:hypothetical protein